MTRLVRVPLGMAPGLGKQAVDAGVACKRQMGSVLSSVGGAWLVTVETEGRRGTEAVYDAHTPGTEEWAKRAEELAPELWTAIGDRRREWVR